MGLYAQIMGKLYFYFVMYLINVKKYISFNLKNYIKSFLMITNLS